MLKRPSRPGVPGFTISDLAVLAPRVLAHASRSVGELASVQAHGLCHARSACGVTSVSRVTCFSLRTSSGSVLFVTDRIILVYY